MSATVFEDAMLAKQECMIKS